MRNAASAGRSVQHAPGAALPTGGTAPRRASFVFRAGAALRPWVEAFWDCRIDDAAAAARSRIEILPSAFPILTFQYGAPLVRSVKRSEQGATGSACAGLQSHLVRLRPQGPIAFLTVRLHPCALARLIREPASLLADRGVDLRSLWRRSEIEAVESELSELGSPLARVGRVEAFLARHFRDTDRASPVSAALALMGCGRVRTVAAAADAVGLSERHFNRSFRLEIGLGPKRYARVARIERLIASYRASRSWAAAAHDAGYSDQPHLVREFQALVGQTPERFLRERCAPAACTPAPPMLGFLRHPSGPDASEPAARAAA